MLPWPFSSGISSTELQGCGSRAGQNDTAAPHWCQSFAGLLGPANAITGHSTRAAERYFRGGKTAFTWNQSPPRRRNNLAGTETGNNCQPSAIGYQAHSSCSARVTRVNEFLERDVKKKAPPRPERRFFLDIPLLRSSLRMGSRLSAWMSATPGSGATKN